MAVLNWALNISDKKSNTCQHLWAKEKSIWMTLYWFVHIFSFDIAVEITFQPQGRSMQRSVEKLISYLELPYTKFTKSALESYLIDATQIFFYPSISPCSIKNLWPKVVDCWRPRMIQFMKKNLNHSANLTESWVCVQFQSQTCATLVLWTRWAAEKELDHNEIWTMGFVNYPIPATAFFH